MLPTSPASPLAAPPGGPVPARGRVAARRLGAVALAAVLVAPGAALVAVPAAAAAAAPEGACTDAQGVTVVVDSTDLGGGIEVGCAPEGGVTGTEALVAAGFSESRDPSGFICAVDGLPDPCPTEFTGDYWSYWFAEPGSGSWESYQEGSDTAVTAPGAVEGWRYGDGGAGPDVALPIAAPAPDAESDAAADGTEESEDAAAGSADGTEEASADAAGPALPLVVGLGLLAALAVAAVVVARRRSAPAAVAGASDDDADLTTARPS
ncbi:hypothetical protein [Actinotalea sp. Marseille-Q4924]|uniref:hypothetical protein n=1 Tax=Actinotalea sp. Marseille-Q4924 TaxID=2866571 RepID=UPI001CE3DC01|nr:hypothetical protein [Actinotalea sp. Marseille-Q4924]